MNTAAAGTSLRQGGPIAPPLPETAPVRSLQTIAVACVLVVLVVAGALLLWRATRPCGSGAGDPGAAVAGVLAALQEHDERGVCRRVSSDYRISDDDAAVLRERVSAAGGPEHVSVTEVAQEQMGSVHVVVVTARDGELVGRFQTIPGQRGAVVVRAGVRCGCPGPRDVPPGGSSVRAGVRGPRVHLR